VKHTDGTHVEMSSETFWAKDPLVLINPKYLHRFFPAETHTTEERMNAVMRLSVYMGLALALVRQSMTWMLLPVVSGVLTAGWMYNENPGLMMEDISKDDKRSRNKYLQALAKEIVSGNVKRAGKLHQSGKGKDHYSSRASKKRHVSWETPDLKNRLYEDVDTIMQKTQRERAELTDSVAGGVANAPRFARKMLERDRERLKNDRRRIL